MANCSDVVFEGWLTKSPPRKKTHHRIWSGRWRRRWFLLTHSGDIPDQYILTYYTNRNRTKLKGVIDLDHCEQVDLGLKLDKKNLKFDHIFGIKIPSRTYYLAADTEEEMLSWVTSICRVCGLKCTNEEEDLGIPMTGPDIEITEESHKPLCSTETPPISPVSTSPYIPISECITGKSPVIDSKDIRNLYDYNQRTLNRNNDCYEMHNSYVNFNKDPNYVNDLQDPRFYDSPRQLVPPKSNKLDLGNSPLQSPGTDTDSVFHDHDWSGTSVDLDISKQQRPSDSSVELDSAGVQKFVKVEPPPRPPKPSHINTTPCYLNLGPTPNNIRQETLEKPKTASSRVLTDDMYDFPRSHIVETEQGKGTLRRHCYNNAAPTKCNDGVIFQYDVSPKPSTSSVTSVFRYDLDSTQEFEPSSPAHSHSSSTPAYSNLPSPLLTDSQIMPPPSVNRELKPRRKLSDTLSTSSNNEPPSPRNSGPCVDRKLKPPTPLQEGSLRRPFQLSDDDGAKRRAAPSPTPLCLADSTYQNQGEVYVLTNHMQYLDLDLQGAPSSSTAKAVQKPNESDTDYKEVDFVKTEAFNITRNILEEERQKPVTTFVKK